MTFPKYVKIVEVGPRDGLQNEPHPVPTQVKIDFINQLSATGLKTIEVSSFVSPKWVPQLADASKVLENIDQVKNIEYPVLVPNITGLENAIKSGAKCISIFTTVSETFCKKNTNCTIKESLNRIKIIITQAKKKNIPVRAYISCVLGCPYEGKISFNTTAALAKKLFSLGCYEISLGDTLGIGTPMAAQALIEETKKYIPISNIAVHFHDTYGQALANLYAVLEKGISIVDTSISGLGGCPYAPGASGNVATEDVLYMLNGINIKTDVTLKKILEVSRFVTTVLGYTTRSKVALAMLSK